MTIFDHRVRMERCLSGERSDRVPIALWRHFPVDDQDPLRLASAIIHFQQTFEFDFIKVTPASSFCIKDYGVVDLWKGNPEGTRDYQDKLIKSTDQWYELKPLSPNRGHLGEQLKCLRALRKHYDHSTPIVQTIFSPLAQAKNLVGKDNLLRHIRQDPEAIRYGLNILLRNTIDFLEECCKCSIDGIFYAIQFAQQNVLTEKEFVDFSKSFDLQILDAVKHLWLKVAHLHGESVMFSQIAKYPVDILNWHDQHTPPDLARGKDVFTGSVCGGLKQWESLAYGDPQLIENEVKQAIRLTQGTRYIIGTGCVTPIITPFGNITAAIHAAHPG